jgi:hypothetical protein
MPLRLASLIAFMLAGFATSAQATVIVNAVETSGNVVFTASGTLSTLAWDPIGVSADFAFINPDKILLVGVTPAVNSFRFHNPDDFVGPTNFGLDQETFANSGTGGSSGGGFGDIFGLFFDSGQLVVPGGYVQGTPLSGTSTYINKDFEDLGMDVGSYTWSWGSAGTADSLTLNVVPEPSTATLMTLGLIGLAARRRRT